MGHEVNAKDHACSLRNCWPRILGDSTRAITRAITRNFATRLCDLRLTAEECDELFGRARVRSDGHRWVEPDASTQVVGDESLSDREQRHRQVVSELCVLARSAGDVPP